MHTQLCDPVGYAVGCGTLANLYFLSGDTAQSEKLAKECVARVKVVLGPNSPQCVLMFFLLADVCHRQGKIQESLRMYHQGVDVHGRSTFYPLIRCYLKGLEPLYGRPSIAGHRRFADTNEERQEVKALADL